MFKQVGRLRQGVALLLRQRVGDTAGATAQDDRDLVERIRVGQEMGDRGMAGGPGWSCIRRIDPNQSSVSIHGVSSS